jgi:hypothetical protein
MNKVKNHVDNALQEFNDQSVSVRVAHAIFGAVPFAPKQPTYHTLGECILAFYPQAAPQFSDVVYKFAQAENVGSAISMSHTIDTGDTGIAVYSGVSSALGMLFGGKSASFDTDTEQGVDAGLKMLGIAYIIYKLFPGSPTEKASAFYQTPAGQALAFYYASIDVALPFADNLVNYGGKTIQSIFSRHGSSAAQKISMLPGGGQIAGEAQSMLGSLMAPFENAVSQVAPYTRSIAGAAQKYLPGAIATADKVAGVVAGGADVLPMYRYLVGRLAAESCVLNASRAR